MGDRTATRVVRDQSAPPVKEDGARRPVLIPLGEIEEAIRSVRYGTVQIIIQDGVVIQIDKTEKMRLR